MPNWHVIQWSTGSSKLFSSGLRVWYWDSGKFTVSWETRWLDFKTGSAYPVTLVVKVKDISGYHYPSTTGKASVDVLYCGGPMKVQVDTRG